MGAGGIVVQPRVQSVPLHVGRISHVVVLPLTGTAVGGQSATVTGALLVRPRNGLGSLSSPLDPGGTPRPASDPLYDVSRETREGRCRVRGEDVKSTMVGQVTSPPGAGPQQQDMKMEVPHERSERGSGRAYRT